MFGTSIKEKGKVCSIPQPKNIYQAVIHKVFSPMTKGRLTMTLPDGKEFIYGQGGSIEARIRINRNDFFRRCVLFGDIGFGEAYVDGDWDAEDLTKVVQWMILNADQHPILMGDEQKAHKSNALGLVNNIRHALRSNTLMGSRRNIKDHYDLGNEFFKLFLDPSMMYSSAYFQHKGQSLEDAQTAKLDRLCRQLQLRSTDYVLEIGSGWGGFALYAAKNYGCRVTTTTISEQQYEYAKKRIQEAGFSERVEVVLKDYRLLKGKYDKLASIEMIEAVGAEYLDVYFKQCYALLKPDGLLGLQMILCPDHRYESFRRNVDWIQKYIFPGSLLPSMAAIHRSVNRTGTLNIHDFKDITASYVETLAVWRKSFNENAERIRSLGFDERFIRKWNYYWSYCEAAFAMRNISVAQVIFSRPNNLLLDEIKE